MRRTVSLGILLTLLTAVACESPSRVPVAPTGTPNSAAAIPAPTILEGTIWAHPRTGTVPVSRSFGVWLDSQGAHLNAGRSDDAGHFSVELPAASRVRLLMSGYMPCAVTIDTGVPGSRLRRDLHLVTDTAQLGAALPVSVLENSVRLIEGTVYEVVNGARVPAMGASLQLDGLFGLGLAVADTVTDAQGRFVFCGVDTEAALFLYASYADYPLREVGMVAVGGPSVEIEFRK